MSYTLLKGSHEAGPSAGRPVPGSETAQNAQANLLVLHLDKLQEQHAIIDEKPTIKAKTRLRHALAPVQQLDRLYRPLYQTPKRCSQICLKFLRWIRVQLRQRSSLASALEALRLVDAHF